MTWIRFLALALLLAGPAPARGAGTTPLALASQFDNAGNLMGGCLLYFYQAGTVATPQQVYSDFGLTQPLPNPLPCSANSARVPMHWLADGLVHVRLTDSSGVVVVDTTLQSLGPSAGGGGGGGGGGTVDPTAVASTGDIKYRVTNEVLPGWVQLNGTSIGSATSGASQRANADTQNLFVYLWTNCANSTCAVSGGRGTTALADFTANKQLTLPAFQDTVLVGRDCMGGTCAGVLLSSNITSGGSDGVDTPLARGGTANTTAKSTFTIAVANLPGYNLPVSIGAGQGNHAHNLSVPYATSNTAWSGGGAEAFGVGPSTVTTAAATLPAMSGTASSLGSNAPLTTTSASFANMPPFVLGTYYMKL